MDRFFFSSLLSSFVFVFFFSRSHHVERRRSLVSSLTQKKLDFIFFSVKCSRPIDFKIDKSTSGRQLAIWRETLAIYKLLWRYSTVKRGGRRYYIGRKHIAKARKLLFLFLILGHPAGDINAHTLFSFSLFFFPMSNSIITKYR